MRAAGGRAADEQRQGHPGALHFGGDGDHFIERRGDQPRETDHRRILFARGVEDLGPRHHHAEVDDVEAVALEDHADDVLADVVDIALDRGHHDPALRRVDAGRLFGLDEGQKMRDHFLHHARRLDDLRQEHLARSEQVADEVHALHQRALDDFDRTGVGQPGFLGIGDDVGVDALDQSMREPLADRPAAPLGGLLLGHCVGTAKALGERDQVLGGIVVAIEDHRVASGAKLGLDLVVDVKLAGVDDRHVEPGGDGMIEEHAVHRAAHGFIAAEREGQVRQPTRNMRVGAADADFLARFDEVDRIAAMLVDPGGDGEDVGVEDDILGREAVRDEQIISAATDVDLAFLGVRLPGLVKRHHDHRGAVAADLGGDGEERFLAFLEANRIDDRLARHALQPGLDHAPLR